MPGAETILDWAALVLAAYAAILSTILAVIREGSRLVLNARVDPPFNELALDIFNASRRRITISTALLVYGPGPRLAQPVLRIGMLEAVVLDPGDGKPVRIPLEELRKAALERPVRQSEYSRLWILVTAFSRRSYPAFVQIHPSIIEAPYVPAAEVYISADLVMGFPRMRSHIRDHSKIK